LAALAQLARSSYAARAVARAVACGVRSIEHGDYLDDDTAVAMAAAGASMLHSLAGGASRAAGGRGHAPMLAAAA